MARRFGQGDLLAGGAAAAAFLLLVFPLGLTPWLAIPPAIATYAVVVLLPPLVRPNGLGSWHSQWQRWPHNDIREATPEERAYVAFEPLRANAAEIRALVPRIAKPAVREQVDRLLGRITSVIVVMRDDGSLAAAPILNDQLVEPFRSILDKYVLLSSRQVRSAEAELEQIETYGLPTIERSVDAFYEKLHRGHLVDLATLREVLEFNLESIDETSPRRFTP
jgi:hypothetical protein